MGWFREKKLDDVPFFINSARLRTARSYFKENYKPEELYKLRLESEPDEEVFDTFAKDGYYGIPRYVSLKSGKDISKSNIQDNDEVYYRNTNRWMGFGLMWMNLKRFLVLIRLQLWKKNVHQDVEAELATPNMYEESLLENEPPSEPNPNTNTGLPTCDIVSWNELGEINLHDSNDICKIYEDDSGSIEQFNITTPDGRFAKVVQFSVGMTKSIFANAAEKDMNLQSQVLSQNCASLIWVQNEKSCVVLITESSDPLCWSIQQWFRKILSDMALADSIMIGHPYYWHPVVRRRLRKAVKYFKKLYKTISAQELAKKTKKAFSGGTDCSEADNLELVCSGGITQVTIAESSFKENHIKNHDFIDNLYDKWDTYKELVDQSKFPTLSRVSDSYITKYSSSPCCSRAQSTTFLNFSEAISFEADEVMKIETLNELRGVSSGKLHGSKKGNLENDSTDSDIYGSRPLDSRWNDETFKKSLKSFLKSTSSEFDLGKKERSKLGRPRKLRE